MPSRRYCGPGGAPFLQPFHLMADRRFRHAKALRRVAEPLMSRGRVKRPKRRVAARPCEGCWKSESSETLRSAIPEACWRNSVQERIIPYCRSISRALPHTFENRRTRLTAPGRRPGQAPPQAVRLLVVARHRRIRHLPPRPRLLPCRREQDSGGAPPPGARPGGRIPLGAAVGERGGGCRSGAGKGLKLLVQLGAAAPRSLCEYS